LPGPPRAASQGERARRYCSQAHSTFREHSQHRHSHGLSTGSSMKVLADLLLVSGNSFYDYARVNNFAVFQQPGQHRVTLQLRTNAARPTSQPASLAFTVVSAGVSPAHRRNETQTLPHSFFMAGGDDGTETEWIAMTGAEMTNLEVVKQCYEK